MHSVVKLSGVIHIWLIAHTHSNYVPLGDPISGGSACKSYIAVLSFVWLWCSEAHMFSCVVRFSNRRASEITLHIDGSSRPGILVRPHTCKVCAIHLELPLRPRLSCH